jgi:replicative DNA helicase
MSDDELSIELLVLQSLMTNESYTRKVLPYIKAEHFQSNSQRTVFNMVGEFITKFNKLPTVTALAIEMQNSTKISQKEFDACAGLLEALSDDDNFESQSEEWMIESTEKWVKDRSLHNAIMQSIQIMDGSEKKGKGEIPNILSEALAVSFDTSIGHDFIEDYDKRFEFYHKQEKHLPFDLTYFNEITNGGLTPKTLNIILAGTNVGKSLMMCHFAANWLMQNKNVLYITMEMAEERIAERIDANLLGVDLDRLADLTEEEYKRKVSKFKHETTGKLIVKEYPTAAASVTHFRHLLNELRMKRKFVPDVIIIDYLNICSSCRINIDSKGGTYVFIKAIAEELRGLAVEFNVPVVSATQTNRDGINNSDVDLGDTAESIGLPQTCDLMFAVMRTEELDKLNQIYIKQLKNRYSDMVKNRKFIIGIDRPKMRLYDAAASAQHGINGGNISTQNSPNPGQNPGQNGGNRGKFDGLNV